jgi:hypothetical protein
MKVKDVLLKTINHTWKDWQVPTPYQSYSQRRGFILYNSHQDISSMDVG